jgi:hypothetical protein
MLWSEGQKLDDRVESRTSQRSPHRLGVPYIGLEAAYPGLLPFGSGTPVEMEYFDAFFKRQGGTGRRDVAGSSGEENAHKTSSINFIDSRRLTT